MHQEADRVQDLIDYYRTQGAPADQQMLIALLREVQESDGGILSAGRVREVADAYQIRESMLHALIRRVSGIHYEDAPHRLEICGTCKASRALMEEIIREYKVKSGNSSALGGFVFRATGCMKNCKNGPSVRWDGELHSKADINLIRELTGRSPK